MLMGVAGITYENPRKTQQEERKDLEWGGTRGLFKKAKRKVEAPGRVTVPLIGGNQFRVGRGNKHKDCSRKNDFENSLNTGTKGRIGRWEG